jgi:hypothetical protein
MKSTKLHRVLLFALAALGILMSKSLGGLTSNVGFGVTVTTNTTAPNLVSFNISVTNLTAATISDVVITNELSGPASVTAARINPDDPPNPLNSVQIDSTSAARLIVATIASLAPAEVATMLVAVTPDLRAGFGNTITVVSPGSQPQTITALASSAVPDGSGGGGGGGSAGDLATTIIVPPGSNPVAGDFFDITVTATNRGPGLVTNVVLTANLGGLDIRSITPSTPIVTNSAGAVPLSLGNLAANSGAAFTLNVTTTNAATFNLSTTVASATNADPDPGNDTATFPLAVQPTNSPNATVAWTVPTQPNFQTGLFEQNVVVQNNGGSTIPAFRVTAVGLNGTNILYNAQGTNNGNPFVVYPAPLAPGASATVVLEIFNARRRPPGTVSYYATELLSYKAPTNATPSTNIVVFARNFGTSALVEFPAVIGNYYTIVYSSDPAFTNNVFRAQPSVRAEGSIVQWKDTGPPKTLPFEGTATRYYRVIEGQ